MTDRTRPWLVVAALVGLAGCGDDFTNPGGVTLVEGRIIDDTTGFGVFDLGIALEFKEEAASAPGILEPAQAAEVVLSPPYPCPVRFEDSLRVELSSDQPIAARVTVESTSRAFPGELAVLGDGPLPSARAEYVWDLRDEFGGAYVPNGIYVVRAVITDPESTVRTLERQFLVNRPVNQAIVLDAFHTYSDPDGNYRIADVPTGLAYTATDASGRILGERRVDEDMTLFYCDIDYRLQELALTVPARTQVTFDVFVTPRVPVAPEYPSIE
jgi:hypothetical protein